MDQKNDNRTPRDRITGEFLSELLLRENEASASRQTFAEANGAKSTACRQGAGASGNVSLNGNVSLAMAYIQMQEFTGLYGEAEGFCEGTIFKQLNFPFYPTPCRGGGLTR